MIYNSPGGLLEKLTYVGSAAGLLFLWTLLETQVIEPLNLNAYMPLYRVDGACVWDVAAIAVIAFVFRRAYLGAKGPRT